MKNFSLILLFTLLLTSGCDDDDGGFSLAPLIEHRGVYINNFLTDGILGDDIKEDELIAWVDENDFNHIYLYNVGAILAASLGAELNDFVEKSHNYEEGIDVTFVSAGFGTSFNNIIDYHDEYPNIPRGIVSEIEFWNGSMTYADDYEPWINKLNSLKFDYPINAPGPRNPDVVRQFYIGKIKDGGAAPSLAIAKELVDHHDEIFLTNYHTAAYNLNASEEPNSIKNKLRLLAQAGSELGKDVNIVILFNVYQESGSPQIWNFFSTTGEDHEFEDAYVSFYNEVDDAVDIPYKEFLNIKGFGIYRYTDAEEARPL